MRAFLDPAHAAAEIAPLRLLDDSGASRPATARSVRAIARLGVARSDHIQPVRRTADGVAHASARAGAEGSRDSPRGIHEWLDV